MWRPWLDGRAQRLGVPGVDGAADKLLNAMSSKLCRKVLLVLAAVQVYVLAFEEDLSEVYQVPTPVAWPPLSRSSCSTENDALLTAPQAPS